MNAILSTADLRRIRTEWVQDQVEEYREIGQAANVATSASVGAVSLALRGLGTGTILRGTRLGHSVSGVVNTYTVADDVLIVAGAATVGISPGLLTAATASEVVRAVPIYRSVFNSQNQVELFSDVDLEDFARRAKETWGHRIEQADDPTRRLYQAVQLLAYEVMSAPGSQYHRALVADDPSRGGEAAMDRLRKVVAENLTFFTVRAKGFITGEMYR